MGLEEGIEREGERGESMTGQDLYHLDPSCITLGMVDPGRWRAVATEVSSTSIGLKLVICISPIARCTQ